MSRLRELIDELCPDGVEYVELGTIADIGTGRSDRKDAVQNGAYPFYVRSQEVLRKNDYEYDEEAILVPGEGGIGQVFHFVNGKYALHQRVYRIHITSNTILTMFVKRYMESEFLEFITREAVTATVKSIRKPMIQKFRIPVPPTEVQREIVRILDSFQELDDALTAEIEAREKQYSSIRDRLLLGNTSLELNPFQTFCSSMNTGPFGSSVHKTDYVADGCPIVNPADIVGTQISVGKRVSKEAEARLSRYKLQKNDIVIGRRGEMGRIGIVDETSEGYLCGTGCFFVRMNNLALPGYWRHFFGTQYAKAYLDSHAVGGTMKNLNLDILGTMPVPVPPMDVQVRVVGNLDALKEYVGELRSELYARRKQFEHYRDKLLSFPEKEA